MIRVESLVQAPLGIQDERADEGAGLPSRLLQDARERDVLRIEHVSAIVPDPVTRRQQPGKDRGVRRQRQRRDRKRLLEENPFAREPIEVRGQGRAIAVGADLIPSSCVERDDDDIEVTRPCPARGPNPSS